MNFKTMMREHALSTFEEIENFNKTITTIKSRTAIYTDEFIRQEVAKINLAKIEFIKQSKDKAAELFADYQRATAEEFMPKGSDITADIKLINSGLILTQNELEALIKQYDGNPTMQRLFCEYADKNDIVITTPIPSERSKNQKAEFLLAYFNSALQDTAYKTLWADDKNFEAISKGVD